MYSRFWMEMDEDRRSAVEKALRDLVKTRNVVVHHLIDRFDLWTVDGCVAAAEHLNVCYERIGEHLHQLRDWAHAMEQTWDAAEAFMDSDVFDGFIVDAIAPDGTVN